MRTFPGNKNQSTPGIQLNSDHECIHSDERCFGVILLTLNRFLSIGF